MGPRRLYGASLRKREIGKIDFHLPLIFRNRLANKPEESKTRCGDSFCIDIISIWANLTNFVLFFICSKKSKQCQTTCPKNATLSTFSQRPSPQVPWDPSKKMRLGSFLQSGPSLTPIGPNGTPFMPIFRFKFWSVSQTSVPYLLCLDRHHHGTNGKHHLPLVLILNQASP